MSEEALPPAAGLIDQVVAERGQPAGPCGNVQQDAPANVCERAKGHEGPHVGTVDGVPLQWES